MTETFLPSFLLRLKGRQLLRVRHIVLENRRLPDLEHTGLLHLVLLQVA